MVTATPTRTATRTPTRTATRTPTPATLPAPWLRLDLGAVGVPGSATYSNGTFTVAGSGADIWGSSDQFNFVYRTLSGDGEIVARIVSVQNTDDYAKAGVMIRQNLTANSPYAMVEVLPRQSSAFQWRLTPGAAAIGVGSTGSAPYWVRLVRVGNTFTAYQSATGTNWIPVGTATTVSMASSVYVGLAVTAHDNTTTCTTVFDNVTKIGN